MKGLGRMRTMNRRLSRTAAFTLGCLGMLLGGAVNAATVMATTEPFRLSIKHDGIRPSTGDETLTYSGLWDGGDGATVAIAQDGVAIAEGLAGEGERAWSVARNGTYTLTHTTYTNGVAGKVETATFAVTGRDVPFGAAACRAPDAVAQLPLGDEGGGALRVRTRARGGAPARHGGARSPGAGRVVGRGGGADGP